ncbi:hypothetical protein HDEF_1397 [Candidatus Hamiltonella defensa 5AT (Acyrthosiphon pisum)]|uniref:Uncharacterized protein n=1 Tax=Hamiltonella defensa subsp. Acyrthosiphon pisum (strain 5AT) TaxID=572265 RepID=C4K636_HAMD5|nr:hypothetical protein HDEF_1397 [Candidatus Hamiltonella defensa 5AT (Acyrthosiphon pisum)]
MLATLSGNYFKKRSAQFFGNDIIKHSAIDLC